MILHNYANKKTIMSKMLEGVEVTLWTVMLENEIQAPSNSKLSNYF